MAGNLFGVSLVALIGMGGGIYSCVQGKILFGSTLIGAVSIFFFLFGYSWISEAGKTILKFE
ncbi:MAG: hypothetical protein AAGA30_20985, partial [Planctomycetota bacterium]